MKESCFKTENTVSHNRLSTYLECQKKYELSYLEKIYVPKPVQDYFITGSLSHSILERVLAGELLNDVLKECLSKWVSDTCNLPSTDNPKNHEEEDCIDIEQLYVYALKVGNVLVKCMESYQENDKIRNKDGTVPKDVYNYPPSGFTSEIRKLGLTGLKTDIDMRAGFLDASYKRFSLCEVAANAFSFVLNFVVPDYVKHTIAVEYEIDSKEVIWSPDTHWNGAIDWVFETVDGALVICDHKTEKKKPSGMDVAWHAQLNLYVSLYYEHTGRLADYVGINHLRSGEIIFAEVNPTVVHENYIFWQDVQKSIETSKKSTFLKSLPTKYGSPCIQRDMKSNKITKCCPYLKLCWPNYFNPIEEEIAEAF